MKTGATILSVLIAALCLTVFKPLAQAADIFGGLPLWFEARTVGSFEAHGSGSEFVITATGAEFTLSKNNGQTSTCHLQFLDAQSQPDISGIEPLSGRINRFTGNRSENWQLGRVAFSRVSVANVYSGIDVVYYANQKNLEYDFDVAAGVDPAIIAFQFKGAEKIFLNRAGQLVVKLRAGEIIQHAPVAYQLVQGQRKEIPARYKIEAGNNVKFALGDYDHSLPLVIDPVLAYSTYFGGNIGEKAWAVAVNNNDGSVYIAGQTFSTKDTNTITGTLSTTGGWQTNYAGGKQAGDAFIARFDSTGTNLIYATYLGGSADDAAYAIAVDDAGNAFVAGSTISSNFPILNPLPTGTNISGTIQPNLRKYQSDAFVAELDPSGSNLLYSTYLGGNSAEAVNGIALDGAGNAFVTGFTFSTNFPVTPDAFQNHLACSNRFDQCNSFLSVIAAGGGALNYSTYWGGTNYDIAKAIAYNNGKVFIAGFTLSTNFPSTNSLPAPPDQPFQFQYLNGNTNTAHNKQQQGVSDGFVTAFDFSTTNPTVIYSTLLGGTNIDACTGIAADAAGNAYVCGYTMSTNFPCTVTNVPGLSQSFVHTNDFQKHFYVVTNSFLTKLSVSNNQPTIAWSAMFGQKAVSVANAVALDPSGNVYITGSATCTNYPVTTNNLSDYLSPTNSSLKRGSARLNDVVVTVMNNDATALLFSAYIGGREDDYGTSIAVDNDANAYITGYTMSTNFPTVNAWQSHRNGTNDMFVLKITGITNTVSAGIASPNEQVVLSLVPQISTGSASQPRLAGNSSVRTQPGLTLKWKNSSASYQVEFTTDLGSGHWQPLPQTPVTTNGWNQLDVPATEGIRFFRLRRQ